MHMDLQYRRCPSAAAGSAESRPSRFAGFSETSPISSLRRRNHLAICPSARISTPRTGSDPFSYWPDLLLAGRSRWHHSWWCTHPMTPRSLGSHRTHPVGQARQRGGGDRAAPHHRHLRLSPRTATNSPAAPPPSSHGRPEGYASACGAVRAQGHGYATRGITVGKDHKPGLATVRRTKRRSHGTLAVVSVRIGVPARVV